MVGAHDLGASSPALSSINGLISQIVDGGFEFLGGGHNCGEQGRVNAAKRCGSGVDKCVEHVIKPRCFRESISAVLDEVFDHREECLIPETTNVSVLKKHLQKIGASKLVRREDHVDFDLVQELQWSRRRLQSCRLRLSEAISRLVCNSFHVVDQFE